ncbi:hypothetical protein [Hyalangium versicolor]|uniref:hypothetical protein n=1 Tax=Hyalangium versicolor TaxID=2861190 RepID=UPI001CC95C21|nr:hypothetical protein [Hyalangium versicolor]
MSSSRLLLPALCLSYLAAACGGGSTLPPTPPDNRTDPLLEELIAQAKEHVLADTCFVNHPDGAGCDWGDFPLVPQEQFHMAHDTGEAILIVDEFPSLPPRVIRYRNRIKGYYRLGSNGRIGAAQASWHAPTVLFNELQHFASPDFIPAEKLRALSEPLSRVYAGYAQGNVGHGSFVFSLLIEANPHQPIVLMDTLTFHQFALAEFCDSSGSTESLALLRTKAEQVAQDLRGIFQQMNIRFVNLSSGQTLEATRREWSTYCGTPSPGDDVLRAKLNTYAPIMEAFFTTPGVFTANAAIEGSNPQDNPFDFPSAAYPNRLLVGYFTSLDSGLDAGGHGSHASLEGWPGRQNVDIYLNSGVMPRRPFPYNTTPWLQIDGYGVDIYPITNTTTSWMAPLALSRFIQARYSPDFQSCTMTNELISELREELVPSDCTDLPDNRCVYQDPLKHGQIEAIGLGYRSREYAEP